MAHEHLATYLNDHLAGSVVAIELLQHLLDTHTGTPLHDEFTTLLEEIEADRVELKSLMDRLEISQSRTRKATAWLAEKFTNLKLQLDDPGDGALRLFEASEILSLGIEGKLALWRALSTASELAEELRGLDYEHLAARAKSQRLRVEAIRLAAARDALVL